MLLRSVPNFALQYKGSRWRPVPDTNPLFREQSVQKIASPEKLDDYIRVTNPSVWLMLGAVAVLLACTLVWGVVGAIPTTLTKPFTQIDGALVSYFSPEDAAMLKTGMRVDAGGTPGTVTGIGETPLSYAEAAGRLTGDYAAHHLGLSEWNVPVTVSCPAAVPQGQFVDVRIVTESVRPIDFLIN
jgi:hypothetical protein